LAAEPAIPGEDRFDTRRQFEVVPEPEPTVLVIEDDRALRESLGRLLRSVDFNPRLFGSVAEFLNVGRPEVDSCLVLDVRLPGQSGLDFQRELARSSSPIPIIFITGHGDIPMSVQAMKGGAVEFLTKPFRDKDLLDAIALALARDRAWRTDQKVVATLKARFATLTPREREIMIHVVRGRLSKEIAGDIGVSEVTVKVHRSNMMRKMNVASLPELGRVAVKLNLV
jgi:FixJ family two-component response regulator